MQASNYRKPLPPLNDLNRPYFEGAIKGELRLQQCSKCKTYWFPPSSHCPKCLSTEHSWVKVSGRGRVWSWTIMHRQYFESFKNDLPYNVVFVKLDEGPCIMSSMVDVKAADIRCDMPVEVTFERVTEDVALPKFKPAKSK